MQEQAELIGGGLAAGGAVGGEMGLPGFDVVFRAAAPAINVLVESLRPAAFEIGHDEPGVGSLFACFDACNDAFDAAPTPGAVVKLLNRRTLAFFGPASKYALALASSVST